MAPADLVVKAQIHAGGRGKGTFANGFKGGVHVVQNAGGGARGRSQDARPNAGHTSDRSGRTNSEQGARGRVGSIAREIYFAILLDRATAAPLIVASTEGGVEIEDGGSEKRRRKSCASPSIRSLGLQPFQSRKLAKQLGFESAQLKAAAKLFDGLYRTFIGLDCSMVEINPLVVTKKGEATCARCQV